MQKITEMKTPNRG